MFSPLAARAAIAPRRADEPQAYCAHLRVSYRTETRTLSQAEADSINARHGLELGPYPPLRAGQTVASGWWECDAGCGTRFLPNVPRPS